MAATASPSEPTYERAVALLELVFHVGRLTDEGRLWKDDGAVVIRLLKEFAFADWADGGD